MHKKKSKIFHFLRRSHRSVGVFLSAFLIMLSVTGVLLNHTDDLKLAKNYVPSIIAARYYTNDQSTLGYYLRDHYYYLLEERLFIDKEEVTHCADLNGVVQHKNQQAILCGDDLLMLTLSNQLVERLDSSLGLPSGIEGIGVFEDRLFINTAMQNYEFDPESLEIKDSQTPIRNMPVQVEVPRVLTLGSSITWQQFFLDVHSGIFVGNFGKWFMDFVALCLCGMAVSGIAMWLKKA
ncbi:MAG: hypothetical protein ACI9FB_000946 [Candidatus Azotimanducaceae bacterium]